MKRNLVKIAGGTFLALAVIAFVSFGPTFAQNESDAARSSAAESEMPNNNGGRGGFVGTWNVTVTLRNCQTYAPIRTFASVTTIMFGGTLIDSTSGIPQSQKTPGHGAWSHAGGNTYSFSFKNFNFDANGNYAGFQIIRQTAYLDPLRDEYFSRGTAEFYNANGNLFMTGCSSTTAARFE
jgi:hypothetical protein